MRKEAELSGIGEVLRNGQPLVTVEYKITVYRRRIPSSALNPSAKVAGVRELHGRIAAQDGDLSALGQGLLTLRMKPGQLLNFYIDTLRPGRNAPIRVTGDFYSE
jgi:hypothetical protein